MEHFLPEWIGKLYLGDAVMQETVCLRRTMIAKTLCLWQGAYTMLVSTLIKKGKGKVLVSSLILAG